MTVVFIFLVAFTATLLSSLSGVGTGIITVPAWLSLGYSFPAAIATNKVAAVIWVLVPARKYLKGRLLDSRLIISMAAVGLLGAWLGAEVTIAVDEKLLRRILGAVIIGLCLWTLRNREFGLTESQPVKQATRLLSLTALPLGFYEGFFGTGNGVFSTLALVKLRGFDLISAMGHYYCLAFVWCLFAAIFYGSHGYIEPQLVVPATVGSLLGSYVGSHLGARGGTLFVKKAFVLCGMVFGTLLLLGVL